jgi:3-oxoacyl-[acyl-carrier protein] reductase/meso-butanediol dehydrogenase/(S,S)-butanediol dehydrogenase/diacetyl reductase
MGELNGKVAIITGAGRLRSIGFETAMALARLGADIVVTGTGRDPDTFPPDERKLGWRDVESTAERVRELGRKALPLVVDVTRVEQVDRMVSRTLEEFGRVDILINNAAMPIGRDRVSTADLDPDVFQRVLDVKVRGNYLCARAVIPSLIRQGDGGKIVNVASSAGKRGAAEALAYCAANFAQVGMTQSLAQELGPHRVNVNCICPAAVDTSRMDRFGRGEQWKKMGESHPIGRTGTREEVGAFIAYLCTEAASWIHGQSINIDGGMVMEH